VIPQKNIMWTDQGRPLWRELLEQKGGRGSDRGFHSGNSEKGGRS